MAALPPRGEMERAYLASNPEYDGVFFLGVRTTGVFCRPTCAARKPLPRNVDFYASAHDALFAGFRPCKRCNPLAAAGEPPQWAQRLLDLIDKDPERRVTDGEIRSLGIDPARARRHFQKTYGMTFQAYARGRRLGKALEHIRSGKRLDDVTLDHGYESHSGFREAFAKQFGVPPGKATGTGCVTLAWMESPLGPLVAGSMNDEIVLLEFTDRRMLEAQLTTLRRIFKQPLIPGESEVLRQLRQELEEYFAGTRRKFTVRVAYPGTPFQTKVWDGLCRIPYGRTVSYEELARAVDSPGAQRAVGHANGLNRIAIVVPCHRVVNKSGELGGYGGGLWRKKALLELERGERQFMELKAPATETELRDRRRSRDSVLP